MFSGQKADVKDLQTSVRGQYCIPNCDYYAVGLFIILNYFAARKLAFSASLLTYGEGNSDSGQLAYRHVITNVGNHYNPTTGTLVGNVRNTWQY